MDDPLTNEEKQTLLQPGAQRPGGRRARRRPAAPSNSTPCPRHLRAHGRLLRDAHHPRRTARLHRRTGGLRSRWPRMCVNTPWRPRWTTRASSPCSPEELASIDIEVSRLTPPRDLEYRDRARPAGEAATRRGWRDPARWRPPGHVPAASLGEAPGQGRIPGSACAPRWGPRPTPGARGTCRSRPIRSKSSTSSCRAPAGAQRNCTEARRASGLQCGEGLPGTCLKSLTPSWKRRSKRSGRISGRALAMC